MSGMSGGSATGSLGTVGEGSVARVAIASGVGANVFGTIVELIAATAGPTKGVSLSVSGTDVSKIFLVEILTGASLSEIYLGSLIVGSPAVFVTANSIFLPVALPMGTRLSAKCSDNVGTGNAFAAVSLIE